MSRRGLVVPPEPIGDPPYRVVFVCTGNICRSPMAEVVARALASSTDLADGTTLADHLDVRSAGTGPWHEGEPMHPLAQTALARARYPDHRHVAHQIVSAELGSIDLLVALDRRHQQTLRSLGADPARLALLRSFDPAAGAAADVPDPYYGDDAVFEDCRDMIAAGCRGLIASLSSHWGSLRPAATAETTTGAVRPAGPVSGARQPRESAGQQPSAPGSRAESVP
ncbi:MAG TPA: low molecular weight protein-tyrosine-phosphatase [Acidimicrobiales bacterium]|nr:low molecular weight protein-tyrosine-phosphatase [Acidimicrobiales bacterium]